MSNKAKQSGLDTTNKTLITVDHSQSSGLKASIAQTGDQSVDTLASAMGSQINQTAAVDSTNAGSAIDDLSADEFRDFFETTEATRNKAILDYINSKMLELDNESEMARRHAVRQNPNKGGVLRLFGDAAKAIESVFSPNASIYRGQKEMLETEMNELREKLEADLSEIGNGHQVIYDYFKNNTEQPVVMTYRTPGQASAEDKTLLAVNGIDLMIHQMLNNRNHPAFGVIRAEIERRIEERVNLYNLQLASFRNRSVKTNDTDAKDAMVDSGAKGMKENLEDLASNSWYLKFKQKIFGKPADKAPISDKTPPAFSPIAGLNVIYKPVTQGALVKYGELKSTEEETATDIRTINRRKKSFYAKRGLQAAFAALALMIGGDGIYHGYQNWKNRSDINSGVSSQGENNGSPAAPSASALAIMDQNPSDLPANPEVIPSAEPTASAVASSLAPKAPTVALNTQKKPAKSPALGYQSTQPKAKVSLITKPELTQKPEVKKPEQKVTEKPAIKKQTEQKTAEFDLEKKNAELTKVTKRISAIQSRFTAFERPVRVPVQKTKFNYTAADASDIPGKLDEVMTKVKSWNTQADADAVSSDLSKIEARMTELEKDRSLQTVPVYVAHTEMDGRYALKVIDDTIAKLGSKSHKLTIHRVVSAQNTGKNVTATFETTEVDLDAARASLQAILERAKKSGSGTTEEEAFADSLMAKKWLDHAKSVAQWVNFAGNNSESMTSSYITYR
ncbi:hypothetical protein IT411_00520 [Candidatus Peregrinibacteria bacterium]|nr:hypothetical protein [Candidatus Peregrinibacteria bacterium]